MRLIIPALLFVLGACQPVIETEYTYIPLATPEGEACAASCDQARQQCLASCRAERQECINFERLDSIHDLNRYRRLEPDMGISHRYDLDDFDDSQACYALNPCDRECREAYQSCFTGCGGIIKEKQICVRHCEKP